MWRMLRVGRILICVYTTNKDCLLLLLLLTHLHHDVYMELKRHLSRSILVAHIFTQATTEHHECAARLWDALLLAFHPRSHQVVSAVIAEAASTIL